MLFTLLSGIALYLHYRQWQWDIREAVDLMWETVRVTQAGNTIKRVAVAETEKLH